MNKYLMGAFSLVSLALGVFVGAFGVLYLQKTGKTSNSKVEEAPKDVYKKVGDVYITRLDLDIAQSVPGLNQSQEDVEKGLLKLALFYNEGKNLGLDTDSIVERLRYWAEKGVVADAFYRKYILPKINVDTSEVMKFINNHKEEFSKEIAMLTVAYGDVKLTDTLKKLLKDGSYAANLMLEELAKSGKISVQPSGYQNVGLGRFALSEKEFEALKNAKKDDVIGPFAMGPNTYVVAKVVDIRKVNINNLDTQIKGTVYQFLLEQRRKQVEDSVFTALLNKYRGGEK